MTCNTISLVSRRLIWKRLRWKFIDIFEDVCSLHACFSADSLHLLCCITPCESSGRFFRATRYFSVGNGQPGEPELCQYCTGTVPVFYRNCASIVPAHFRSVSSGGASAVKEPGHFEVRKSSSQVRSPRFPDAANGSPAVHTISEAKQ